MVILQAGSEHIPAVYAIERACFPDPWPEEILMRRREMLTIAAEGDAILGYIVFSSVLDEGSIDDIAVAPAHRRKGVADALIVHTLQKARDEALSCIYLEVRVSNTPAVALYEKHGFESVGLRKNYYEKPKEDAILMTKVL